MNQDKGHLTTNTLPFLEKQIPVGVHKRLYDTWVEEDLLMDVELETMWDPEYLKEDGNPDDNADLISQWTEDLIELARALNDAHWAMFTIKSFEVSDRDARECRDRLEKAILYMLPNFVRIPRSVNQQT